MKKLRFIKYINTKKHLITLQIAIDYWYVLPSVCVYVCDIDNNYLGAKFDFLCFHAEIEHEHEY